MSLVDQTSPPADEPPPSSLPRRDTWGAIKRGARNLCPACGRGKILYAYLKVHDSCSVCGEELHHQRADDFPPYLTILTVGHILAGAMLFVDAFWPDLPLSIHFTVWPTLTILMSLWLLPIFKGALIAYQWALRMHGFETAHQAGPKEADLQRSAAA